MKKIILALVLIITSATFVTAQAQHISVSININSQPAWGPVGYDYVDYYYIPEINVYYNVPMSMFYYWDRGRWISARYLPYSYRNYNLYGMYKVVLNTRDPWHYNRHHVRDYARYRNVRNQHVIYYAKDKRYDRSRRNTASWYKGGKHNAPPRYNNDSRPGRRDNDRNHNQTRSARVENNNKAYNNNNNNRDRSRNDSNHNNNSTRNNSRNEKAATRSQRSNPSENRSNDNRQQTTTRSSSQSYLVNNATTRSENKASDKSSSQRTSSRSQSERSSSTRSNR